MIERTEARTVNVRIVTYKMTRRQHEAIESRLPDVCTAISLETGASAEVIAAAIAANSEKVFGARKLTLEIVG
jgi:hypothetical protein